MNNEPTTQAAARTLPWGWVVVLALPAMAWVACETIWPWFSAMDCAWQEGNACVRILRGDLPGRDFQLFHGIGVAWVHLPVFLLAGAGERAVACTHYASAVLACGALAWRVFGTVAAGRVRLALAVATISLACALPLVRALVDPLGNMASTRAAIGALVALVVTGPGQGMRSWVWRAGLLGLAAACFADQAAILALTVFGWGLVRVFRERRLAACVAWVPLAGLVLAPLWQWLLCGGRPAHLWAFQWQILPAAQTWFWAPTQRFFRCPADLWWLADRRLLLAVAAHVGAWVVAGRAVGGAPPALRRVQSVLVLFSVASLLPLVGYLSLHYFHAAGLTGCLSLVAALWHAGSRLPANPAVPVTAEARQRATLAALSVVFRRLTHAPQGKWSRTAGPSTRKGLWCLLAIALVLSAARVYESWVDCPYGARDLGPALDKHCTTIRGPVWSFYRGALDHRLGNPPGPEEDLIIYAVGTRRADEYAKAFRRTAPAWVHTPSGAPFNDWLGVRYWATHRELLAAYAPVCDDGPWATWRRMEARDDPPPEPLLPVRTARAGPGWEWVIDVPVADGRPDDEVMVECSLTYGRTRKVSRLGDMLCRWVVTPADPRSGPEFALDPGAVGVPTRFPLVGRRGDPLVVRLAPHGLGSRTALDLGTVSATTLPAPWLARWNLLMQADTASMPRQSRAVAPD